MIEGIFSFLFVVRDITRDGKTNRNQEYHCFCHNEIMSK